MELIASDETTLRYNNEVDKNSSKDKKKKPLRYNDEVDNNSNEEKKKKTVEVYKSDGQQ